MLFGKVANCLLIIFVALANGMPQNDAKTQTEEKAGVLPFIQFTNGGIRLNFGGYHAEAGLGGLLRGTGAGLHASVGTPWGAHAGAGLGGNVDGNDGNLGGGLYARAGLGRGRPEAAAGLGGRLDGRSSNPISGGLYAGATPGGGPGPGVYLGGGYADGGIEGAASGSSGAEATMKPRASDDEETDLETATRSTKGRTNIQIIPSRAKNAQKEKEKAIEAAAPPADAPAGGKAESQDKGIRRDVPNADAAPAAVVGLVGSVEAAPILKSIEKTVAVSPVMAAVPDEGTVQTNSVANKVKVDKNPRHTHPRWYIRKRFWTSPRKVAYIATADTEGSPSEIVGKMYTNMAGEGGTVVASKTSYTGGGSLFDDIFNIPISTLSAVNQLLRNNVG